MNSVKRIGTFALLTLVAMITAAQSIVWSMSPSDYSNLDYIGFEMFKATDRNGSSHIIDASGNDLTGGAAFDEMTPFYENWALLLAKKSSRTRLIGCISVDRICNIFPSDVEYYTIPGQEFFSCGLLTVENQASKKGYIDEKGELVIDFAEGYDKIMPFSENFAAVFKNNRYMLIDKFGEKASIVLPRVGEIRGGTNVNNGKALVWDNNGRYYNYDVKEKACSKANKPGKNATPDYLYRLTDKGDTPPYMSTEGHKGLAPISSQGKYGYALSDGKTLVACQFKEATQFIDGLAIAKTSDGKAGILKYDENSSNDFAIMVINGDIKYSAGESVTCKFLVRAPTGLKKESIKASIDGVQVSQAGTDGSYSFKYSPKEQHKSFTVKLSSEGLMLYTASIDYDFSKKEGKGGSSKGKEKGSSKKESSGKKTDKQDSKKSDKQDQKKSGKNKKNEEPKKPERL